MGESWSEVAVVWQGAGRGCGVIGKEEMASAGGGGSDRSFASRPGPIAADL
jgi:hypothetical protein